MSCTPNSASNMRFSSRSGATPATRSDVCGAEGEEYAAGDVQGVAAEVLFEHDRSDDLRQSPGPRASRVVQLDHRRDAREPRVAALGAVDPVAGGVVEEQQRLLVDAIRSGVAESVVEQREHAAADVEVRLA